MAAPYRWRIIVRQPTRRNIMNWFSYVAQLKTPDTLNLLGYVSPAANSAQTDGGQRSVRQHRTMVVAANHWLSAGWSRRRGWWAMKGVCYPEPRMEPGKTADPYQRLQSIPE